MQPSSKPSASARAARLAGPPRQAGKQPEGQVGGRQHLVDQDLHRARQALPAELRLGRQSAPPAVARRGIGLAESPRRPHDAILDPASFDIPAPVQRLEPLRAETPRFLQDAFDHAQVGLGMGRQSREDRGRVEHILQQEHHVAHRRRAGRHATLRRSDYRRFRQVFFNKQTGLRATAHPVRPAPPIPNTC
ncbi:hypothetical protein [Gluconacetobacter sacchari]|nr:hypothetical protein [Gluconacetobacter sacchari]